MTTWRRWGTALAILVTGSVAVVAVPQLLVISMAESYVVEPADAPGKEPAHLGEELPIDMVTAEEIHDSRTGG